MGLPDDGQHDRIDMARIVTEILRLLDQRGIGCKGETLLQELRGRYRNRHEALRTIVAPSKAGGIDTPHPLHLLFGVEAGAGHAVTGRKTERMLRRSTMPAAYGSREQQQVFESSLHHRAIGNY